MNKSISFLLFGPVLCPGGGMKIILEYANRLVADGYEVNIVYPATINWKKRDIVYKLKSIYHYFLHEIRGWKCNRWFNVDERVKEIHSLSLNYRDIPKTDIYIATEARTAPYVAKYPIENSRKYYFIQGYENWFLSDEEVRETYHLPLNKIVIADWLNQIVEKEEKESCVIIKNSFDFAYFKKTKDIKERNPLIVATLYNESPVKDVKTTLRALDLVHDKYPDLKVLIFGTEERPVDLPQWYEYTKRPTKEKHNEIYNNASIFIGSSISEGWGLTIGEGMICGAAIVCTDIAGYKEMAVHNKTALVSPIKDAEQLAKNIIKLIENNELRYKIAEEGNKYIQKFNWEHAYPKLKTTLNL